MLTIILIFIYGIGFGLTFIGQLAIIGLSNINTSLALFCAKVICWPLTWGIFGYKIWKNDND